MSQDIGLLVHIGPLREESETLIKDVKRTTLLALLSPMPARQQSVSQSVPALHAADQSITPAGGEAICYTYNLKDFNSLAPANELTSLYPGLNEACQQPIDTQTLPQALEQAGLSQAVLTHLVIEQPEIALSLLQSFEQNALLEKLTHLWIRTSPLVLYDGMTTNDELSQWCEQHGFEVMAGHVDDPDFFLLGFTRSPLYSRLKDTQTQLATLNTQFNQLTAERDALKKQLNQATKASQQQVEESAEQIKTLRVDLEAQQAQAANLQEKLASSDEERDNYQRYFTNRKKQHEEAEKKLADAQQMLSEKDTTITRLSEQLAALQQSTERFEQLESKLESLFGEQRGYIQQTTSALGQHVTRSARQQRDEQALTHYLQHGQRPVSPHLAPGYAMALLEHYDNQHHDVVVIFGSQDTTELLAQSIINSRSDQPRLTQQNSQHQEAHNGVTLSHDDLPQTIVSVQHQKTASDELKKRLDNKQLSHAVNVVYAPWIECQANGQTALFYAAEATLQRLNQWLPENARILVIVGDTLATAGHSREIALPLLLQQLPTQQLDIILEGNHCPQERDLINRWEALLETRQRTAQWLKLANTYSLRLE
ncbi:hypothetical protein [Halomonas colorata]|uniref:Uncharacterized protein n=1 Tax=Halomonas colorata TaxID=2742615 RepID=A0ABR9G0J3_9GAMM|nr:hypothetical protein [Halomonas colorata]MBE0464410.1 hypothetical protein [Halomonas colorata]